MIQYEILKAKADQLGPWRYDHREGELVINGDPVAAPIHGDYGRGRDTMRHILSVLARKHDLSQWRAIDLGCLEGHYTELLCEAGIGEVVAVDLSTEQVARAKFLLQDVRNFANVRIIEGSVEDERLLASLGRFDLILFHGLLYHLQDPLGMFSKLRAIGSDHHYLLLSTQFKFTYAEVVTPSPIANIKFRSIKADDDGKVRYDGTRSTYAPLAMRLNPAAIHRLLKHFGYAHPIHYDTPLGSTYGLQLHVIAATGSPSGLVDAFNAGNPVSGLVFSAWQGDAIDGIDFRSGVRNRLIRFIVRVAYSLAERLGQSASRQLRRISISDHHKF